MCTQGLKNSYIHEIIQKLKQVANWQVAIWRDVGIKAPRSPLLSLMNQTRVHVKILNEIPHSNAPHILVFQ